MIKIKCSTCKKPIFTYPCRIKQWKHHFCSKKCGVPFWRKHFAKYEVGRYTVGHKRNPPSHYKKLAELLKNENHPKWKGAKVSYRGLHQWVRRYKGKPTICSECGLESTKPRVIQWANIDGKYRRNLDDFISLCCSCHKFHDMGQSIQDVPSAN